MKAACLRQISFLFFLVRGKVKAKITKGFVSLEEEGGGTAAAAVLLVLLVGSDYYWWIDKLCMGFGKLVRTWRCLGRRGGDRSTICTLWTRFEPRTAWHFWYGRWQGCRGYFLVWLRAIVE